MESLCRYEIYGVLCEGEIGIYEKDTSCPSQEKCVIFNL
jgi:hypothetical protein